MKVTRREAVKLGMGAAAAALLAACAPAAQPSPTAAPKPAAPAPAPAGSPEAAPAAQPAAASPAAAPAAPASVTTLRMMYPIRVPSPDYAFIWAGDELGYFREEGLKLDIQPTAGSVDSVRLTAVGQGDLSVAGCDGVVIGRTQGQNMRCCFVHAQRQIYGVAVLDDSPIKAVADLKGKTLGVQGLGSGAVPYTKGLLKENGLNPDADVTFVEIGVGPAAISALKGGRVDASAAWDTEFFQYEQAGLSLRYFNSPALAHLPGSGVHIRDEDLDKRAQLIEGYLRAYTKGMVFSMENPAAAVELMGRQVPDVLKDKDKSVGTLKKRQEIFKLPDEANGVWGWSKVSLWDEYVNFLFDNGLMKSKVDGSEVWTDRFLQAANRFDADQLRRQARDWRG